VWVNPGIIILVAYDAVTDGVLLCIDTERGSQVCAARCKMINVSLSLLRVLLCALFIDG